MAAAKNDVVCVGSQVKDALIKAHEECNKAAINAKFCSDLGISEQSFEQWKGYVANLHSKVCEYLEASHDPNVSAQKLTALEGAVFAAWKDVLKNGTAEEFSRAFFIRKTDIVHLAGLCGEKFISTAIGTRMANHTANDFRRNIERLVGVRMVVGGYLKDEDATAILDYEGAVKTVKKQTVIIDGNEKTKTEGLVATIAKLEAKLDTAGKFATQYNFPDDVRAAYLAPIKSSLDESRKALTQAQKTLKEAQTKRDNLEVRYNETISRLHRIDETF